MQKMGNNSGASREKRPAAPGARQLSLFPTEGLKSSPTAGKTSVDSTLTRVANSGTSKAGVISPFRHHLLRTIWLSLPAPMENIVLFVLFVSIPAATFHRRLSR